MKKMVSDFQIPFQSAHTAYENLSKSGKNTPKVDQLWNDIQFNLEFVRQGRGEHNVEYAVKVMKSAISMTDTLLKTEDPGAKPLKMGRLFDTPDGYCTLLCHGTLGVPEETKVRTYGFPS